LWTLLVATALWLLVEAAERCRARRDDRWWWLGFGLVLWLCLFVHYYTIFLLPALPAVCLLRARGDGAARARVLKRLTVTLLMVVVGFPPISCWWYFQQHPASVAAWIAPRFDHLAALQTLWCFLPAGYYPDYLPGLSLAAGATTAEPAWSIILGPLVALGILMIATARAVRRWTLASRVLSDEASQGASADVQQPWAARSCLVLLLFTAVPLALAWLYSLLVRPIYLPGRYDLIALPAWMAMLAIVLVESVDARSARGRRDLAGMVLLLVAAALLPVGRLLSQPTSPSLHRLRADRLAGMTRNDDRVVAFSYDRDYLQYYLYRAGFAGRLSAYPSWLERQMGWLDTDADLADAKAQALDEDARQQAVAIVDAVHRGHRAFVLGDSLDPQSTGRRASIQGRFFAALRAVHCSIESVDDTLGIARVTCSDT
jgi:hypothetical protein